ncbi:MAG: TonB-dependent receptor, partial [Paramuribaculum sp.]|nr:TonB-dependent receptor [Paramuribaculum sp.]
DNEKTLVVSFIGMLTQDVAITSDNLTIFMEEAANNLDEVVVVGYGTTTKRKTTTSVSTVKASELEQVPVPNLTQTLAGRAAGLIVSQQGGGLDAGANISIRGGGTPLYVIDNIVSEQREFQNLNPSDIESISVLKDAAGTAIYGQRAGNGIIIVTTKRGQTGKVNVDYQFNYSLSGPTDLPSKLSSYDQARYWNLGYIYDGETPRWSDADLESFRNGTDPEHFPNTNWQREVLHKVAPEMRHQLTITGGSERVRAYTALSYYDQSSLYRSDMLTYKRYNARTNVTIDVKEIGLTVTTGLEAYITNFNQPISGYYQVWSHIQNKWAGDVARNPFGQPYGQTVDNPLQDISPEGGYNRQDNANVRGTIDATWMVPWVKGLSIVGRASYSFLNERNKTWNKQAPGYTWDGTQMGTRLPSLSKQTNWYDYYNTQLFANYNRDFGKNNVELTLGIEATGSDYSNLYASRINYVLDVDQFASGPTDGQSTSGANGAQYRTASVIFRAHYDYAARYMAEFALRHDGADKFPKNHRWGTFFSGSLGWNVSEESFWKESQFSTVWNMFKIRASLGEIGQDSGVGHYDYLTSYSVNQRGAYLGQSFRPTFSEGALPSPDISWYTQRDFNVGFDFALFQNAFSGSVDYFYKSTKGFLASPSNVGYTAPLGLALPTVKSNGELRRRGVDFTLQYNGRAGDFTYQIGGNFTFFDTRYNINPYESESSLKNPYTRGTQVADYYGNLLKSMGFFASAEDVMNSPQINGVLGGVMAGDIKYWDFNGDGKIDGNDMFRQGKDRTPQGNYGITLSGQYQGFGINMLWQGATASNMMVGSVLMGNGNTSNNPGPVIYEFQTDIWSPENTDALYPRPHSANYGNNFQSSDFWLIGAQYLRLKNLTISYDFKHKLLKKVNWLSKCNINLTGYNLLTFSPAKKWGLDPEAAGYTAEGYNYPVTRTYTVSINIGF